jgi:hypothetical protein
MWLKSETTDESEYDVTGIYEISGLYFSCENSSSHGGEYEVHIYLLGCTAV